MNRRIMVPVVCVLLLVMWASCLPEESPGETSQASASKSNSGGSEEHKWDIHSKIRPRPKVVDPGENWSEAPSDAIVLFDGNDLSKWESVNTGGPAKWKVENGYMEVVKKTGYIQTKEGFGSCQLHIEWCSPKSTSGDGQHKANSGVFLMGKYEIQILDSYNNETYADGQASAIYGQNPPAVNACRPPGKWQSYDIIFHRPIFKDDEVVRPGTLTVFHNGLLVHDHWVLKGTTRHNKPPLYQPHPDRVPLKLQDHGDPVRFRNIWLRELED